MRHLALLALAGCAGSTADDTAPSPTGDTGTPAETDTVDTTDTDPQGACGDVTVWQVTLTGGVLGADDQPAPGVSVWVEDRGWAPGTVLATGTTDAKGQFVLDLQEVTSVEDCWAILLDYVLVGERPGERGEKDLNTELYNAIDGGTLEADLGAFPLRLQSTP